jgi:hypothetical protein
MSMIPKYSSGCSLWLLAGMMLLALLAALAYGVGARAPEVAQIIVDAQRQPPGRFQIIMESRKNNPPPITRSPSALPFWSILALLGLVTAVLLWQASRFLDGVGRAMRRARKGRSTPRPAARPTIDHPPALSRPIEPIRPLLPAPAERSESNGQRPSDSIDDVGWA